MQTVLQITTGVHRNHCGEAPCVRHRLEQLRAYGAQELLELQSITHVSVSCSSAMEKTWLNKVDYSVECDHAARSNNRTNTREGKLEASEQPVVEKLRRNAEEINTSRYLKCTHSRKNRLQRIHQRK